MTDASQLYLMTPAGAQAHALGPMLAEVMDRFAPSCLRIRSGGEEDELVVGQALPEKPGKARCQRVIVEVSGLGLMVEKLRRTKHSS